MDNSRNERNQKLVELAKVQGDFEAQVIKGMLESEGIEVAVRTGVTPIILPFTVDGLGQVRLFVKESDLDTARAVLREAEKAREAGDIPFEDRNEADTSGEPKGLEPPGDSRGRPH